MTEPRQRPAKRRPATGSKIAAAGLGMTAMFGLVGAMALAQGNGASNPAPTQVTLPSQVVVVPTKAGTVSAPIQLSAPTVHQAPSQAPAATTSGSR